MGWVRSATRWQRDGVDVAGATGGTYTLGNADVGHSIDVDLRNALPTAMARRRA